MSTNREELHRLADELPEAELAAVLDFARARRPREGRRFVPDVLAGVPIDDEPLTDEERADVAAAREEDPRTRISAAEARRRWG